MSNLLAKGPYFNKRPWIREALNKLKEGFESDQDIPQKNTESILQAIEAIIVVTYCHHVPLNRRKDEYYQKGKWKNLQWKDGHLVEKEEVKTD